MRNQVRLVAATATLAIAGSLGLLVTPAFASAGHTITFTDNFHGSQQTTEPNPCNGDPVVLDQTSNTVMHVTSFANSDESWATFTEEDRFTGTDAGPVAAGVVYTGHSTFWGNFNLNRQNQNFTITSTIIGKGSDGSRISSHEVGHTTMLPDGNVSVTFDKPSLTCSG
jgi:hypothetical protein